MKVSISAIFIILTACSLHAADYHVSPSGLDSYQGSAQKPLLTIQAAAELATPGDTITVHAGVYRERVNPPRGGTSDDKRIVYQAAPGEQVVIKGSEMIKGWVKAGEGVWKVTLPNSLFGDFNPYSDVIGGEWYGTPKENGFDHLTGAVYLNAVWMDQAQTKEHHPSYLSLLHGCCHQTSVCQ
jgi:alpha-N-arabinofuranosidase